MILLYKKIKKKTEKKSMFNYNATLFDIQIIPLPFSFHDTQWYMMYLGNTQTIHIVFNQPINIAMFHTKNIFLLIYSYIFAFVHIISEKGIAVIRENTMFNC